MTGADDVTASLTAFVAGTDAASIPEHVKHAARRTIANSVCLSAAAARHAAIDIALAAAQSAGVSGSGSLLGRPERTSTAWAATLNAMSAHVEDFDDTHLRTVTHPGAPIVPAALAMAERTGANGDEVLTAVILGTEVALRVASGICPGHFDRCWHVTGTVGHLGAAVAAARLLGLDRERLAAAIAIAATQAAGVQDALGTMTKCLNPGKAAGDGVRAAQLARLGLAGPPDPIEGRHGLGEVMAPSADYAEMTQGLGRRWEILDNAFKPYACGIVSHPVIDGAIAIRAAVPDVAEIDSVRVRVNPVVLDVMGVEEPADGLQSKFSVYHCFAVGYLFGGAAPAQFSDQTARAEDVAALRRRVSAVLDPSVAKDECFVVVTTASGARHEHHVAHATGSVDSPMTDEQLRGKSRLLLAATHGDRADLLFDLAIGIDALDFVNPLFAASQP
jgi:2-methylcitrate dehydratase PrpD